MNIYLLINDGTKILCVINKNIEIDFNSTEIKYL